MSGDVEAASNTAHLPLPAPTALWHRVCLHGGCCPHTLLPHFVLAVMNTPFLRPVCALLLLLLLPTVVLAQANYRTDVLYAHHRVALADAPHVLDRLAEVLPAYRPTVPTASAFTDFPAHRVDEITLQKRFFGGAKFVFGGQEPQPIYTFTGFSLHDAFEEVLSLHPEALREAKRTIPYNVVTLGGSALVLIGSIQMLSSTLDDASDLNEGRLPDSDSSTEGLGTMLVGAGVMLVGALLSRRHLNRSISMFNERQRIAAGQTP